MQQPERERPAGALSPRLSHLERIFRRVTGGAAVIFLVLGAFLLITHEFELVFLRDGTQNRCVLTFLRPVFSERVATIFGWDLALFLAAVFGLGLIGRTGRRGEALLGLVLVLDLWRVVLTSFWRLLSLPGVELIPDPLPGTGETLVFVVLLGIGKEWLASTCTDADTRFDSPLLEVFCWHHRKDAVFNLLFGLALAGGLVGFAPARLEYFAHVVKIWLLGTASFGITVRCMRLLTEKDGEGEATDAAEPSR